MMSTLQQAVDAARAEARGAGAPVAGEASPPGAHAAEARRLADLAEIIAAYNQVTDRLQKSHETLQSEVDRLRCELAEKNAQLERSKRLSALGEMAAGIAHEIRNPLAAIGLYARMVLDDLGALQVPQAAPAAAPGLLAEADENVRRIDEAVRGLTGIVEDVLSFARQVEPEPQRRSAHALFQAALDVCRPGCQAADVSVVWEVPPALTVTADPEQLRQVLINLVRNAIEAMAGRPERVLTLSAELEGAGIGLRIADTGPGIPADAVERIFNPFFTTRSTGTGLGLAIVHRIVDAHGGRIAVGASAGGGAVFRLWLPDHPVGAIAERSLQRSNMPSGVPYRLASSDEQPGADRQETAGAPAGGKRA